MPVMNVQDFSDGKLQMMSKPCIMKGFGSCLSDIQAAFQTFAINLKKEAVKVKGCPGRLMDDLSAGDLKVLNGILHEMFTKKLSQPAQKRFIMWPNIHQEMSVPALTSIASPILFGNVGQYEATMCEKKFCGSMRIAFSGRRIVSASPWSVVVNAYKAANPPKEGDKPPVAKVIRDWYRNLTEDRFAN